MFYGKYLVSVFKEITKEDGAEDRAGIFAYIIEEDFGNLSGTFKKGLADLLEVEYANYIARSEQLRADRIATLEKARAAKAAKKAQEAVADQNTDQEAVSDREAVKLNEQQEKLIAKLLEAGVVEESIQRAVEEAVKGIKVKIGGSASQAVNNADVVNINGKTFKAVSE